MWLALFALLLQLFFSRPILENEDARVEQPSAIVAGLNSSDPQIQRIAVRALGRFEKPQFADEIRPLLASPDAGVRMETINALGQMNASFDAGSLLNNEKDAAVRSVIFETAGRIRQAPANTES